MDGQTDGGTEKVTYIGGCPHLKRTPECLIKRFKGTLSGLKQFLTTESS